jgi:hypothetical protein
MVAAINVLIMYFYSQTESEILRAKNEGALPFMVSATAGNY